MTLLGQAKTLGGVGSILLLLTIVPSVGSILGIVGLVLILLALKYISDALGDRSIFNNAVIAVILAIVGIVLAAVVIISYLFNYVGLGNISSLPATFNSGNLPSGGLGPLISAIVIALAAVWIFYIVSAIFLRRSFNSVSTKLSVGMFHTAALIYLIGAALAIVLVGFILIYVADILFIVAFFSIPETIVQGALPGKTLRPSQRGKGGRLRPFPGCSINFPRPETERSVRARSAAANRIRCAG